jgi:hypothetical protein
LAMTFCSLAGKRVSWNPYKGDGTGIESTAAALGAALRSTASGKPNTDCNDQPHPHSGKAREIAKVGKLVGTVRLAPIAPDVDESPDPQSFNPITGRPWGWCSKPAVECSKAELSEDRVAFSPGRPALLRLMITNAQRSGW